MRCGEQLRASSRQAGTSGAAFPPTMQVPRRAFRVAELEVVRRFLVTSENDRIVPSYIT